MNINDMGGTSIKDEKIAKLEKKEASERTLKNQARREIITLTAWKEKAIELYPNLEAEMNDIC